MRADLLLWLLALAGAPDDQSLQARIDRAAGQVVSLAGREWRADQPIRLDENSANGLAGPGTIVQTDPDQPIVEVEHATDVTLSDLTLTRAEPARDCTAPGLLVSDTHRLAVQSVRVEHNQSQRGAIELRGVSDATISGCEVLDYKRVGLDDRTGPPGSNAAELYGYAFRCLDGTGILIADSRSVTVDACRIIERRLHPTREARDAHGLGGLVDGRHPATAGRLADEVLRRRYARNWHQGSAILISGPRTTAQVMVRDTAILNAGQGIDIHADEVTCLGNRIHGAMIGIKATHGSSHLSVLDNEVRHAVLWGIYCGAGSASTADNRDEHLLIAANRVIDCGEGEEAWNWAGDRADPASSRGIYLDAPQLPESPPLRRVRIIANTVAHTGAAPAYAFALCVAAQSRSAAGEPVYPEGLLIFGNHLTAGRDGLANVDLARFAP